jgi:hypothetical protein
VCDKPEIQETEDKGNAKKQNVSNHRHRQRLLLSQACSAREVTVLGAHLSVPGQMEFASFIARRVGEVREGGKEA